MSSPRSAGSASTSARAMPWRSAVGLGGDAAAVDPGHHVHAVLVAGRLERLARHPLEADAREVLVEVAAVDRVGALARLQDHARHGALALAGGRVAGVGGERRAARGPRAQARAPSSVASSAPSSAASSPSAYSPNSLCGAAPPRAPGPARGAAPGMTSSSGSVGLLGSGAGGGGRSSSAGGLLLGRGPPRPRLARRLLGSRPRAASSAGARPPARLLGRGSSASGCASSGCSASAPRLRLLRLGRLALAAAAPRRCSPRGGCLGLRAAARPPRAAAARPRVRRRSAFTSIGSGCWAACGWSGPA